MKKKYIFTGIAAFGAIIGLASCNNQNNQSPDPTPVDQGTDEFKDIELDLTQVKTKYYVGQTLDTDNLKMQEKYENTVSGNVTKKAYEGAYTVKVLDSTGAEVVSEFKEAGIYTAEVSISTHNIKKTYSVTVSNAKFDKLEDACDYAYNYADRFITNGTYKSSSTAYGYTDSREISYKKGHAFTAYEGDNYGTKKYSYIQKANDEQLFIVSQMGEGDNKQVSSILSTDLDYINGAPVDYNVDGEVDSYGAAGLVYALQAEGSSSFGMGYTENMNATGVHFEGETVYTFSYAIADAYGNDYTINIYNVEFTTNNSGAILKAYVSRNYYRTTTEGVTYDATANTYSIAEGVEAVGNASFEFVQECGQFAPNTDNPYQINDVTVGNFTIKDGDTTFTDGQKVTIDLTNGNLFIDDENKHRESYTFDFGLPEDSLDYVNVIVSGTAYDGFNDFDDWSAYNYVMAYGNQVVFKAPGTYTLTFKSVRVTKTITFEVLAEAPTSIAATALNEINGEEYVETTSEEIYVGQTLNIKALIDKSFDQGCAITCEDTGVTLVNNGLDGICTFSANAAGTYTVKLTAAKAMADGTKAEATLTVVVKATPDMSEVIKGEYNGTDGVNKYTVTFTPSTEGALTGTVVVVDQADATKTETFTYTYSADNGLVVNHTEGTNLGIDFVVNKAYKVCIEKDSKLYVLKNDADEVAALLNGNYTTTIAMASQTYYFKFIPTAEGATSGVLKVATLKKGVLTEATYQYAYNESTGAILTVLTSTDDFLNDNPLQVVNGVITWSFFGTQTLTVDTGNDPFVEKVEIPSNFVGTWTAASGEGLTTTIVITSSSITWDGNAVTDLSVANGEVTGKDFMGYETIFVINDDGDLDVYDGYTLMATYKKQQSAVKAPAELIGTWTNSFGETITITETGFSAGGYDYVITQVSETQITGKDNTDFEDVISILSNGNISYYGDEYSKGGSQTVKVPSPYIGTWEDTYGDKITITETTFSMDGYTYVVTNVTATSIVGVDDTNYVETLTINSSGKIVFNDNEYEKKTSSGDNTGGNTGGDTTPVTILEKYYGTWVNTSEGFSAEVSANGVTSNGTALTVTSCTADSIVVTVTGATYTCSINSDGNLSVTIAVTGGQPYTFVATKPQASTVDKTYLSQWLGSWFDGEYTITITNNGVNYCGVDCEFVSISATTLVIRDGNGNLITITYTSSTVITDQYGPYTKQTSTN